MMMNLQLFAGGHSVTVYADAGYSAASADETSDVQKNATVTLTLTPATNYEIDEVEVITGGVTIDMTDKTFKMGEADVVLYAKSKSDKKYMVTENTYVCVNGTIASLTRNLTLQKAANGAVIGVTCSGTAITLSAEIVAALVEAGVLVKM